MDKITFSEIDMIDSEESEIDKIRSEAKEKIKNVKNKSDEYRKRLQDRACDLINKTYLHRAIDKVKPSYSVEKYDRELSTIVRISKDKKYILFRDRYDIEYVFPLDLFLAYNDEMDKEFLKYTEYVHSNMIVNDYKDQLKKVQDEFEFVKKNYEESLKSTNRLHDEVPIQYKDLDISKIEFGTEFIKG